MKRFFILVSFLFSTLLFNNAMSAGEAGAIPDIEGKQVMDSSGAEIGDVDRVAKKGTETLAIIGLKDSMKEVAVPISNIQVEADGSVTTTLSKAELEAYEDIDPMDYEEVDADETAVEEPATEEVPAVN